MDEEEKRGGSECGEKMGRRSRREGSHEQSMDQEEMERHERVKGLCTQLGTGQQHRGEPSTELLSLDSFAFLLCFQ